MTVSSHVAAKANLTMTNGQVKLRRNVPEPMCPARLGAIRPSRSACASGPPTRFGVSASHDPVLSGSSGRPEALTCQSKLAFTETQQDRFRTSGWNLHPLRQIKTPHKAAFLFGGGGSLQRTRLQPKFPANREKYRDFHSFCGSNRAPPHRNPYPERLSGHLPCRQARCGTGN